MSYDEQYPEEDYDSYMARWEAHEEEQDFDFWQKQKVEDQQPITKEYLLEMDWDVTLLHNEETAYEWCVRMMFESNEVIFVLYYYHFGEEGGRIRFVCGGNASYIGEKNTQGDVTFPSMYKTRGQLRMLIEGLGGQHEIEP